MIRRRLLAGALILGAIVIAPVFGQSNEVIDSILAEDTATVGQAAYLAVVGSEGSDGEIVPTEAYQIAVDSGWINSSVGAEDPVTFGQFAHMMMQAFDERGGVMYRIMPGPRYAAREFVAQRWTLQPLTPGQYVAGELLLRITGNYVERKEASL